MLWMLHCVRDSNKRFFELGQRLLLDLIGGEAQRSQFRLEEGCCGLLDIILETILRSRTRSQCHAHPRR